MNANGVEVGGGAIGIQLNDNYNFPSGANGLRITLNLSDTKLGPGSVDAAMIIAYWSYLPLKPLNWNARSYYSDEVEGIRLGLQRKVKIVHDFFDFSSDWMSRVN